MQDTETQQIILNLIEYAQSAKHIEFHLLCNWYEYKYYRSKRKSLKLIVRALRDSTDRLFKSYCNDVAAGKGDFTKLLAYQQIQQVIKFYSLELQIVIDMLEEYEVYLANGNFFLAFLGTGRSELDMRDFRK